MDPKIIVILVAGILLGGSVSYGVSYFLYTQQIDNLTIELDNLDTQYETLFGQLGGLQQEHESLTQQFEDLQQEHESLLGQFETISGEYEELSNERDTLVERIEELSSDIARNVKINEVLYNPLGADDGNEWVEIYNSGVSAVNLTGWTFSGKDGSVEATLPSIIIPPDRYLIIHFGPEELGMSDTNFEDDGQAYYFVGTLQEVFDNDGDAIALYMGEPGTDTIVDYVTWNSVGGLSSTTAGNYASDAGIWTQGTFLDTSYASGNFVMRGETIGRSSTSTDTDRPEDWDDNGGSDAWGPTEGRQNSGPLYAFDVAFFIVQFDVNTIMWEYGFNVSAVTARDIQVTESENILLTTVDYDFMVEILGVTVPFSGIGTHKWWVVNETAFSIDVDVSLTSDRGESFTLTSLRTDQGIESQIYKWQRNLSATYVGPDGLDTTYSYSGSRTLTQTAADTFYLDDARAVVGLDGIERRASATVSEVIDSDTTSHFILNAEIISEVEEPELVHMETYLEMDGDRQFNITIPVYSIRRGVHEFNLLEPATIEFRRVAGQPRDSFGAYQYTYKRTLGNQDLGFATTTVSLYEDYTKVDGKPTIRGEVTASLDGYHVVAWKFYVYDWWRRALRTGLRVVSGAAWAVGCFAGTTVGAPTCVGKFVAVGACGAGGVATDSLISDLIPEKK